MDRPRQFLDQGGVYRTLAGDARQALKGCGNDPHPKMGLPARPRAGVAGMKMRFVLDLDFNGIEGGSQLCADCFGYSSHFPIHASIMALLSGRCVKGCAGFFEALSRPMSRLYRSAGRTIILQ